MVEQSRPPAEVFVRFCECLNRYEVRYLVGA